MPNPISLPHWPTKTEGQSHPREKDFEPSEWSYPKYEPKKAAKEYPLHEAVIAGQLHSPVAQVPPMVTHSAASHGGVSVLNTLPAWP